MRAELTYDYDVDKKRVPRIELHTDSSTHEAVVAWLKASGFKLDEMGCDKTLHRVRIRP